MSFKSRLASTLTDDEFEKSFTEVFREHFKAVGGRGLLIVEDDSIVDDDASQPFFVLCREIAEFIKSRYEFYSVVLTLFGTNQGMRFEEQLLGLHLQYDDVSIRCYLKDQSVILEYSWPEGYSTVGEDGMGSGGSHTTKGYTFDLSNPKSIQDLFVVVECRAKDMLDQWRPSD